MSSLLWVIDSKKWGCYIRLMLKNIWKKVFGERGKKAQKKLAGEMRWAEKQIKEMAKLRGKLILM